MENNTTRSYVVDVNDKGSLNRIAKDLKANKKLLDDVRKSATAYKKVLQDLGFSNAKQQIGANKLQATGGASTATANAVAQGEINRINATTGAIRVQEKRVASLRQAYKSLGNEITLALSKAKRKDFDNLQATNSVEAKRLVEASQFRVGQAQLNTTRAPDNKNYQKQLAAERELLLKNEKSLERIVVQEKERAALTRKTNAYKERMDKIDRKIADSNAKTLRYRQLGNRLAVREQKDITRKLQLSKLNNQQEALTSVQIKEHIRLTNRLNASKAKTKLLNEQNKDPLEALNRRLKDGGAGLFKIQAQLLANYAAMGLALGALGFSGQFIIDLDKEFKQLQSITATTDTNMQGLKNTLISVSEETKFTALEIAQAATILGQAGFSVSQIEASISPIAKLATAVGTDLNTAVDLVTSTITVFNLRAEETATVANVFTAAVNNSKLNLEKLTLGIQYSGNIAAEQNIEFTELTATLGAMANSGIRAGSTLGTGLRQVLTSLAAPSAQLRQRFVELGLSTDDTDVKLNGLTGVLNNLKEAGFTTSDAMEYMEVRAGAAFAAMSNNIDTIGQLQTQFLLSNAAAEANATQMESLANKGARLKSIFGTLVSNGAGPLTEVLKELLDLLAVLLQTLNALGPVIPVLTAAVTALVVSLVAKRAALFSTNLLLGKATTTTVANTLATNASTGAVIKHTLATSALGKATSRLWVALGPVGVAVLAITTSLAVYKSVTDELTVSMDELEAVTEKAEGRTETYRQNIKAIEKEIGRLSKRMGQLKDGSVEVNNIGLELSEKFKGLGVSFDFVNGKASDYVKTLIRLKNAESDLVAVGLRDSILAREKEISALADIKNKEGAAKVIGGLINNFSIGTPSIGGVGGSAYTKETTIDPKIIALIKRNSDKSGNLKTDADFKAILNEIRIIVVELSKAGRNDTQAYRDTQELAAQITRLASLQLQNENEQRQVVRQDFQNSPIYRELEGKAIELEKTISRTRKAFDSANPNEKEALRKELLALLEEARGLQSSAEFTFLNEINKESANPQGVFPTAPTFNPLYNGSDLQNEIFPRLISNLNGLTKFTEDELKTQREYLTLKSEQYQQEIKTLKRNTDETNTYAEIYANKNKALVALDQQRILALEESDKELKKRNSSDRVINNARAAINLDFKEKSDALIKNFDDLIVPLESRVVPAIELAADKLKETIFKIDEAYRLSVASADNIVLNAKARKSSLANGPNRGRPNTALNYLADKEIEKAEIQRLEILVKAAETRQKALLVAKDEALAIQSTAQGALDKINDTLKRAEDNDSTLRPEEVTKAQDELNAAQSRLASSTKTVNDLGKETSLLQDEIKNGYLEIAIASGTVAQPVMTASARLKAAFSSYKEELDARTIDLRNFEEAALEVSKNIEESLGDAFYDIITGAKSVGAAFKDMAVQILKAMAKILAEQAAIFLVQQLVGVFTGGATTQPGTKFGSTVTMFKSGGEIKPKHMYAGGSVPDVGVRNRDSVPIIAEPGEFMLRKAAVEAIGVDTLRGINAMGNRRVSLSKKDLPAMPSADSKAQSLGDVNVWLVKEGTKPTLGPRDILQIISEDIIQKGQTKQLIKQVSLGTI